MVAFGDSMGVVKGYKIRGDREKETIQHTHIEVVRRRREGMHIEATWKRREGTYIKAAQK